MEERKGDVRIYFIYGFFFCCVIFGGVFLCLYIFFPNTSPTWYLIVGMALVGMPWIIWALTCVYRCSKPLHKPSTLPQFDHSGRLSKGTNNNSRTSSHNGTTTEAPASNFTTMTNPSTSDHSPENSPGTAHRKVQFGAVIVVNEQVGSEEEEASNCSKENKLLSRSSPV